MTINEACPHPRARHHHGTPVCYKRDRCRCDACRQAAYRYDKRGAHQARQGSTPTGLIDATAARNHLLRLRATGLGWWQIEARTGIHRTGLRRIAGDLPNRPPSRRIRATAAAAILATTTDPLRPGDRGMVDPTGSIRRLQALATLGWPQEWLRERLGCSGVTMGRLRGHGQPIIAATAVKIAALYNELWDTPPVATTVREQQTITRTRRRATRQGWAPPMAWDDDTIDNPGAQPDLGGGPGFGGPSFDLDDVEWLLESGETLTTIAARLHAHRTTIQHRCRRNDRPDLWERLVASEPNKRAKPGHGITLDRRKQQPAA